MADISMTPSLPGNDVEQITTRRVYTCRSRHIPLFTRPIQHMDPHSQHPLGSVGLRLVYDDNSPYVDLESSDITGCHCGPRAGPACSGGQSA